MYTEQHQQDPLILLNSQRIDDLLVPITIKPLPALLAPPTNLSLSTASLQTPNTANSYYQYNNTEPHIESVSFSEQSPLPQASLPDLPPTTTTPNYYTVIQKQSQEIQDLRHDLIRLNQKYIDQIERMQTAEQAKHQVESELEDLSLRLFEQANQMVSDEKKARFHAEKKITQLERELTSVYEELNNEKAQLSELRVKIHEPSIHPLERQQQQQQQQQQQGNWDYQSNAYQQYMAAYQRSFQQQMAANPYQMQQMIQRQMRQHMPHQQQQQQYNKPKQQQQQQQNDDGNDEGTNENTDKSPTSNSDEG